VIECQVDEASAIRREDVEQILLPTILDQGGTMIVSGTFRGRNWVFDWFERAKSEPDRQAAFLHRTDEGPMFASAAGRERLERWRARLPSAVAAQELDCIPSANLSAAFRPEDLLAAETGESTPDQALPGRTYFGGLDLGRTRDPCAFVCLDDSGLVVESLDYGLDRPWDESARYAQSLCARWRCADAVGVDTTLWAPQRGRPRTEQSDEVIELFRGYLPRLHPYVWNLVSKERLIQNLIVLLEQRALRIPKKFVRLHEQLAAYECKYRGLHYQYGAPGQDHDDLVAALAMACAVRRRIMVGAKRGDGLAGIVLD
jgi:hypothetical protein